MTRVNMALLAAAITLAISLNFFVLIQPFFGETFDGETHLFFADHYSRKWFDPLEERWFGGFSVFSYPPLVHQLIAAVGSVIGIENGYRVVQGSALTAYPLATWFFVSEVIGANAAGFAAFLSPLLAGVYMFLYTFGQLPSFVGIVLTLVAVGYFTRYLRDGVGFDLVRWILFSGAAALSHHHSVLFVLPLLTICSALLIWISDTDARETVVKRFVVASFGGAVALGGMLLPFWGWFFVDRMPIKPIPYLGRDNLFSTRFSAEMFFWGVYGGFLSFLVLPRNPLRHLWRRNLWPLGVLIAFLAVLGLGYLTPVPKIVFRTWSEYLIYDGFALWAALLLTIPISIELSHWEKHSVSWRYMLLLPLLLSFLGAGWSATYGRTHSLFTHIEDWEESEIVRFLEDGNHEDWYYITLGLREPDFARLSRRTSARTVDGYYYIARRRTEFRESGAPMLDIAAWSGLGALDFLRSVLREPQKFGLKWAIVARREYEQVLRAEGWVPVHPIGSDASFRPGDPVRSTVWIWKVPDNVSGPPIHALERPPIWAPSYASVIWGVVPLTVLGAACILSFVGTFRRRALSKRRPVLPVS